MKKKIPIWLLLRSLAALVSIWLSRHLLHIAWAQRNFVTHLTIFRYAWMDAGPNFGFFISFPGEELPFATPHSLTYSLTRTHLQTHIGSTHSLITPIKPKTEPTIHLSFSFPTLAFCGCPWGSLNHTSRMFDGVLLLQVTVGPYHYFLFPTKPVKLQPKVVSRFSIYWHVMTGSGSCPYLIVIESIPLLWCFEFFFSDYLAHIASGRLALVSSRTPCYLFNDFVLWTCSILLACPCPLCWFTTCFDLLSDLWVAFISVSWSHNFPPLSFRYL